MSEEEVSTQPTVGELFVTSTTNDENTQEPKSTSSVVHQRIERMGVTAGVQSLLVGGALLLPRRPIDI